MSSINKEHLQELLTLAKKCMAQPGTENRHLLVPTQEKVASQLLQLLDTIDIPLSLWINHQESSKLFDSDGAKVKIGERASDGSWKDESAVKVVPAEDIYLALGSGEVKTKLCTPSSNGYSVNVWSLLDAQGGAREGLTLRKHTQMVMIDMMQRLNFFLVEYEKSKDIERVREFMILLAMIHDIGKSLAHAIGDKNWRHELSLPMLDYLGKHLGLNPWEINLAKVMVDHDIYGKLMSKDIYPYPLTVQESYKKLVGFFNKASSYQGEAWSIFNQKLFHTLTLVHFLADGFGGYAYVRSICGYIRQGAIIAQGENAGKKFYQVAHDALCANRQKILFESIDDQGRKIHKSPNVEQWLKSTESVDEKTLLLWFATGQLRTTELVKAHILTEFDIYFNEPTIDQQVYVEHIAHNEKVAAYVYNDVPAIPRLWAYYNGAEFWGPLSG